MKKKPKKHPREMTTEEAMRYLFHPKVVKHVKKHVAKLNKSTMKKA